MFKLEYTPTFLTDPDPTVAFERLWNELAWERRGSTPRREYYCNELPIPYVYGTGAGVREYLPQPWHPIIADIKEQAEGYIGTRFEVAFLNGYENSKDQLGWHSDDSDSMDDNRPIAIVTLGAVREFWVRPKDPVEQAKISVFRERLAHGSIMVMGPGMQDTHQHRIPKADHECGPRISITLRGLVT